MVRNWASVNWLCVSNSSFDHYSFRGLGLDREKRLRPSSCCAIELGQMSTARGRCGDPSCFCYWLILGYLDLLVSFELYLVLIHCYRFPDWVQCCRLLLFCRSSVIHVLLESLFCLPSSSLRTACHRHGSCPFCTQRE